MTRATLLSLLAHPAALSAPDVRALEALAQAFPYCQTAHLLLAKAAHDQDSMLAAQRLRRAATYAADRTRLRQLIELPALVAASAPVAIEASQAVPASADALPAGSSPPDAPVASGATSAGRHSLEAEEHAALEDRPGQVILPAASFPAPAIPAEASSVVAPATPATDASAAPAPAAAAELAELPPAEAAPGVPAAEAPPVASEPMQAVATETAETASAASEDAPAAPVEAAALSAIPALAALATSPTPLAAEETIPAVEAARELPAQAPPIRPPATAGAARFEFGLAASEAAELTAYRLPEPEVPGRATPPATPQLPPFSGAPDISYAPGEGSRLGFCLVLAEPATPAALPGSGLPPAGEFFAPDALLLDFLAALPPAELPRPSSLELINNFLQRAPLASRRRAMPSPAMPDPEAQADLSLSSTRVEPDLVSENLAAILARQGKNERAIVVYERLMAKYPEKMAYFAAQIESLRP